MLGARRAGEVTAVARIMPPPLLGEFQRMAEATDRHAQRAVAVWVKAARHAYPVTENRTGERILWSVADTFDFPQDLLDAQMELHQVQAELHALYERLPWSAEPMVGYGEDFWRPRMREDSPGYTDEEKDQLAALRARQLDLTVTVSCHEYWASCPGDVVKARSALKHAHEPADGGEESAA